MAISDLTAQSNISDSVKTSVVDWMEEEPVGECVSTTTFYYRKQLRNRLFFIILTALATVLIAGYSLSAGKTQVGFVETYSTIFHHIMGDIQDKFIDYMVVDIRLPRVLGGIIAGSGLAVCGVVMQSVLKNPLADPFTTGVSSGASFGATIAISTGMVLYFGYVSLITLAFVCSMVPIFMIIVLSKTSKASPTTMIMAGIGVMYIFNAFTTVLKLWANPDDLSSIYTWEVGSLSMVTLDQLPIMGGICIVGLIVVQILSGKLNILATGDDNAKAMGIDAETLRIILLLLTGLISASIVSFTGLIGFIGLVSPHICRMFVGADNRYLIPASAMFGSMFLILADLIGRAFLGPIMLQVGVVMSFVGGPLFIMLILKRSSKVW